MTMPGIVKFSVIYFMNILVTVPENPQWEESVEIIYLAEKGKNKQE